MHEVEYEFLRRTWFPVATLADVDRGVVGGNVLGEELVVYRTGGRVTVAQGRCPHRGMALWLGQVRDGCLECPYHGWLFAPDDGRCVRVPALPAGSRPATGHLRTYPVREAYGHVWTCLDEPYLPFPTLLGYGADGWRYGFGEPTDLACGMRQLTENFRDMAHFPFVHAESMGPHVRREVDPYEVHRHGWELEWTFTTDLGGTAFDGNTEVAARQTLTYRVSPPMVVYSRTSFPNGGSRLTCQLAVPINRDGTRVRQFWVVGIDEALEGPAGVTLERMWEYERQIFVEDQPIVQNQWPVEAPLDVHSQVHTRSDKYSIVYRRTYLELLGKFAADHGLCTDGLAG